MTQLSGSANPILPNLQ